MSDLRIKAKCPICGMSVISDTIKAEYKGETYYFCSETDKKMFIGDPEKYLGKTKVA